MKGVNMANRIPRNAKKLFVTFKANSHSDISVEKNKYGEWIGTDQNGKKWCLLVSLLRNSDYCSVTVME